MIENQDRGDGRGSPEGESASKQHEIATSINALKSSYEAAQADQIQHSDNIFRWTRRGAKAAILYTGLTILIFGASIYSVSQTREIVNQTSRAAKAAEDQVQATKDTAGDQKAAIDKQTGIASDTEQRQLRAYVGLTDDPLAMIKSPDRIIVTMKNFGQTPTKSVELFINWAFVKQPAVRLPDGFEFPDNPYCPARLYGAQTIYPADILKGQRQHCPDETKKLSEPNIWAAFIYGHVIYFDVFGNRWRNNYCLLYGASGSAYCDRYNEIDS